MSAVTTTTATVTAPTFGSADIQLFTLGTPNGFKISIALEELGVSYDAYVINIMKNIQFEEWFKAINPNSKIPAIVDQKGADGKPLALFESGAILLYLAEKYHQLLPTSVSARAEALSWLFWQVGGLGPMAGQTNHFHVYCKDDIPYAKQRYATETNRLLDVLDAQLKKDQFIVGNELSIADIASWPWVDYIVKKYAEKFEMEKKTNLYRWWKLVGDRPAVQRGIKVGAL